MIVEISDTSIQSDLINDGSGKLALYAQGGVPIVWVVDIDGRVIHEFLHPENSRYIEHHSHGSTIVLNGAEEKIENLIA